MGSGRLAALAGGRWGAISSISEQSLALVSTSILARLLAPSDFGLIAVAGVVTTFLGLVAQVGLTAHLIQRPEVDEEVVSTAFWASVVLAAIAFIGAAALSGVLAGSFRQPEAQPYIRVMASVVGIGLLASVPNALLQRNMRFSTLALWSIVNMVIYVVVAVSLAAGLRAGAWSVVIGRVAGATVEAIGRWAAVSWRPRLVFVRRKLFDSLRFNLGFLGNRILNFVSKNADYWAVGRVAGNTALGNYYMAFVIPNVIRQRLTSVAADTMFPVLSRLKSDEARFTRGYFESIRFVALVAFPTLVGLAVVSDLVVPLFLGDTWSTVIAPMAIVSVAAAIESLYPLTATAQLASGQPWKNMSTNAARLVTLLAGLVLAATRGDLTSFAAAVLASAIVAFAVSQFLVLREISASARRLVASLGPSLLPLALMTLATYATKSALSNQGSIVLQLAGSVATGASVYVASGFLLHRRVFGQLVADLRTGLTGRSA